MNPTQRTVFAQDGYPIGVEVFAPVRPRAVVILAPAMGVAQRFYQPFATWLATQGIACLTFDYRGMGASRPKSLRNFSADLLDWAKLDAEAVLRFAHERFEHTPLLWVGHSVGAQIFGLIPSRHLVQGMMSIAAGSGYWRLNAAPLRYYVLLMWHVLVPLGVAVSGYFPGKRLGAVGDLPAGVAKQWRAWCLAADYMGSQSADVRKALEDTCVPVTALSFRDDEMMTLAGTQALFSLYKNAPVDIRRIDPSEYGVRRIGHFGFFRASAGAALWPIATRWVDAVLGDGRSVAA
jgi:predicted alpha/beta hydrolase